MQLIGLLIPVQREDISGYRTNGCSSQQNVQLLLTSKKHIHRFWNVKCSLKNLNPTLVVSVLGLGGGRSRPNILVDMIHKHRYVGPGSRQICLMELKPDCRQYQVEKKFFCRQSLPKMFILVLTALAWPNTAALGQSLREAHS